ncbi:MAG: hypothetical protein QF890_09695 [Myxococcota bacterium]|jgi:hypothetical protein|nr:hypothetical protein [Deltaproteobacteria bacterium]MCP4241661.1 hypothetical protein [bacterium]MDP6075446.1 hypothetical protein [Myxococcota bacterium]MDP6242883.1 hypothetical protein [Myxococcota bacterium]MDP7075660.1 hypothetical protein [Myxococcota bacterium]
MRDGGSRLTAVGSGALVFAACLAVVYATPRDAYWIADCGNKAILSERLLETGFSTLTLEHPAAAWDPAGEAFPIPPPFALPGDAGFVSQYPPLYSALAAPFLALFGPAGLRVPAALGVAACVALFVLWTAPVFGPRWAALGGLALGLASPLFFYGTVVWEHSLTVALALAAVVLLGRPSAARAAAAGSLAALACAFRAELVLMGIALAVALTAHFRRAAPAVWFGAGALPVLGAWLGFNTLAYGDPLGVHVAENVGVTGATAAAAPLELARRATALLTAYGADPAEGAWLALALLGSVGTGIWAARRGGRVEGWVAAAATAVGAAVCLLATAQISTARVPLIALTRYNGLLAHLPWLALAGLGAAHLFREAKHATLRVGVGAGLLFLAAALPLRVALTSFETGGFWGPRMLLPALPALVATAVAALRALAPRVALPATAVLFAAGLVASAGAVEILARQKLEVATLQDFLRRQPQEIVVTNHPALGQQLAGAWGEKALLHVDDDEALARLAGGLGQRGAGEFLVLDRARSGRKLAQLPAFDCRPAGAHRGRHMPLVYDLEFWTCRTDRGEAPLPPRSPSHSQAGPGPDTGKPHPRPVMMDARNPSTPPRGHRR